MPANLVAIRINLRDAFYSLPLHPRAPHLTTFKVGTRRYQFTRLPMGLSCSPRILQGVLQEVIAPFRVRVHTSWVHIDDVFFAAPEHILVPLVPAIVAAFSSAGFTLNERKSLLVPSRVINYLGLTIDFTRRSYAISDAHVRTLLKLEPLFHSVQLS